MSNTRVKLEVSDLGMIRLSDLESRSRQIGELDGMIDENQIGSLYLRAALCETRWFPRRFG